MVPISQIEDEFKITEINENKIEKTIEILYSLAKLSNLLNVFI